MAGGVFLLPGKDHRQQKCRGTAPGVAQTQAERSAVKIIYSAAGFPFTVSFKKGGCSVFDHSTPEAADLSGGLSGKSGTDKGEGTRSLAAICVAWDSRRFPTL